MGRGKRLLFLKRANLSMTRPFAAYGLKLMPGRLITCLLLAALMMYGWNASAEAREITDMTGRKVELPDEITRIYTPSPVGFHLLYTLNPDLLCGRLFPLRNIEKEMLLPQTQQLPLLGSLTGEGGLIANKEMLSGTKFDIILMVIRDENGIYVDPLAERAEETLSRMAPCVYVYARDLNDYPAVYRFLGEILGQEARAEALAAYIDDALTQAAAVVKQVPLAQRPKVYYAEGADGLSTEDAASYHTTLLKLSGDLNVHRKLVFKPGNLGYERLSMEQLLAHNPDFILAYDRAFYESVYHSRPWQRIKAVQNRKVLWIPRGPYNWFDRPPGFMGALGLKWLLLNFYPAHYTIDLEAEAARFYELFLWITPTPEQIRTIINPY